jgi:DNA-binding transcriptional ArsR family regulator
VFDGTSRGSQTADVDDETEGLRALAHPLRLRMLSLLTGTALSAAEVARELGGTHANASYHLRHLRAAGLVEVTEEVTVRGGRARRYRHVPATDQPLRSLRDGDHVVLAAALATELQRRTALRRPGAPSPMADAELWVPHEVWRDVCDRVTAAMTDLHAAARPPRASGTVRTSTTVSMFAMTDGDSQPEHTP